MGFSVSSHLERVEHWSIPIDLQVISISTSRIISVLLQNFSTAGFSSKYRGEWLSVFCKELYIWLFSGWFSFTQYVSTLRVSGRSWSFDSRASTPSIRIWDKKYNCLGLLFVAPLRLTVAFCQVSVCDSQSLNMEESPLLPVGGGVPHPSWSILYRLPRWVCGIYPDTGGGWRGRASWSWEVVLMVIFPVCWYSKTLQNIKTQRHFLGCLLGG